MALLATQHKLSSGPAHTAASRSEHLLKAAATQLETSLVFITGILRQSLFSSPALEKDDGRGYGITTPALVERGGGNEPGEAARQGGAT